MGRIRKNKILELVSDYNARIEDIQNGDSLSAEDLLANLQEDIIQLGNYIEAEYDVNDIKRIIESLECACENIYNLAIELQTKGWTEAENTVETLKNSIENIRSSIECDLPSDKIKVVFFPYKAAMWDSLETIYLAAIEDNRCEVSVVPIPYYDRNQDGSFGEMHLEKDMYDDSIETVDWQQYDLEMEEPDIAYIHNPYDEYNLITSVHPIYYSKNLKKYVKKLVYCPYFATPGDLFEPWTLLPSYVQVDYLLAQSKLVASRIDYRIPREKIMILGSPKFDKVIGKCKKPSPISDEWKEIIGSKRVYMYNTGPGGFMTYRRNYLDTIKRVISTFEKHNDAVLLWRPHPLLESTIKRVDQSLLDEYFTIKEEYLKNKKGILDTSSSIEDSISHCYAYIGDGSTSLLGLFGIVCKPVFLLDIQPFFPEPEAEPLNYHGFERLDGEGVLCCFEDEENSLEDFLTDNITGGQFDEARAREYVDYVTDVSDETSGTKIHDFVMSKAIVSK